MEVLTPAALRLLDRLFDHMARDVFALGLFDDAAEGRIGVGVGHAILGRHVQLLAVLGVELGFRSSRLEDRLLAILEISSHTISGSSSVIDETTARRLAGVASISPRLIAGGSEADVTPKRPVFVSESSAHRQRKDASCRKPVHVA